eukprot:1160353-Pelagomonas_calceolata.AAC.13
MAQERVCLAAYLLMVPSFVCGYKDQGCKTKVDQGCRVDQNCKPGLQGLQTRVAGLTRIANQGCRVDQGCKPGLQELRQRVAHRCALYTDEANSPSNDVQRRKRHKQGLRC